MKIALLKKQTFHMCMGEYVIFDYTNYSDEPLVVEVKKCYHIMTVTLFEPFKYGINVYGDNFEVLDENSNVIGSDKCD